MLIELPINGFGFLQRRIENDIEDSPLLVTEEGTEGVSGLTEVTIEQPNDGGKVSLLERCHDVQAQLLERVFSDERTHAAGYVVATEV